MNLTDPLCSRSKQASADDHKSISICILLHRILYIHIIYIYRLYYIVIWVIWYLLFNFYVSRKLVAAMLSYAFLWPSNFALCPQQRGSTVKLANSWEENRTWHDLNMFDLGTNLWRWLQRLSAMPGTRFASPDTRGWVEMGYNLWCLASWADMIQQTSPNWEGCRDKVWVTRLSTRYALFPVAKPIGKLSSKGSWVLNVIDNYLYTSDACRFFAQTATEPDYKQLLRAPQRPNLESRRSRFCRRKCSLLDPSGHSKWTFAISYNGDQVVMSGRSCPRHEVSSMCWPLVPTQVPWCVE